jgi:hypothetical protein
MAGNSHQRSRKDTTMRDTSMRAIAPTPNIAVTIGGQLRVYFAYVTTADPALDGPSTLTLYQTTLADLSGFAADPIVHDTMLGKKPARLVLIDLRELAWHRARYREESCLLAPADPMLVNLSTLQHWLWQRLQAPAAFETHA